MMIIKSGNRSPKLLLRLQNGSNSSYHKLPKNLIISLSILKLDGSSFGVDVSRNATVAGIKLALEEVFSLLPEEDQCNVSWSDIWGHFCLCYQGQKLINDKINIRKLGIKDGDQLQFLQHISINYGPKSCSKKLSVCIIPAELFIFWKMLHLLTNQLQSLPHIQSKFFQYNCNAYAVLGWVKCA